MAKEIEHHTFTIHIPLTIHFQDIESTTTDTRKSDISEATEVVDRARRLLHLLLATPPIRDAILRLQLDHIRDQLLTCVEHLDFGAIGEEEILLRLPLGEADRQHYEDAIQEGTIIEELDPYLGTLVPHFGEITIEPLP